MASLRAAPDAGATPLDNDPLLSRALSIAHDILLRARHGALATVSPSGMPFGSLQPIVVADAGTPMFALREDAEHARNLRRDPRASLLIIDPDAMRAPLSGSRVTLVGRVELASGETADAARAALSANGHAVHTLVVERMRVSTVHESRWILLR